MQETDNVGKKTAASNRPALNCLQYLQPGADGKTNCTCFNLVWTIPNYFI